MPFREIVMNCFRAIKLIERRLKMRFIGGILVLISSGLALQATPLPDSLYTFNAVNQTYTDDIPATLGFVFSVKNNFNVTSLGWFDECLEGFQDDHYVGLYDQDNGALLTSTTFATGSSGTLDGFFRYQSIIPVTLSPGTTYLLAGTTGNLDGYTENDDVCGFFVNPNFTIPANGALFADKTPTSEFVYPEDQFKDYLAYAGPNLQGYTAPEPASLALFSAGLLGLLALRRRKLA